MTNIALIALALVACATARPEYGDVGVNFEVFDGHFGFGNPDLNTSNGPHHEVSINKDSGHSASYGLNQKKSQRFSNSLGFGQSGSYAFSIGLKDGASESFTGNEGVSDTQFIGQVLSLRPNEKEIEEHNLNNDSEVNNGAINRHRSQSVSSDHRANTNLGGTIVETDNQYTSDSYNAGVATNSNQGSTGNLGQSIHAPQSVTKSFQGTSFGESIAASNTKGVGESFENKIGLTINQETNYNQATNKRPSAIRGNQHKSSILDSPLSVSEFKETSSKYGSGILLSGIKDKSGSYQTEVVVTSNQDDGSNLGQGINVNGSQNLQRVSFQENVSSTEASTGFEKNSAISNLGSSITVSGIKKANQKVNESKHRDNLGFSVNEELSDSFIGSHTSKQGLNFNTNKNEIENQTLSNGFGFRHGAINSHSSHSISSSHNASQSTGDSNGERQGAIIVSSKEANNILDMSDHQESHALMGNKQGVNSQITRQYISDISYEKQGISSIQGLNRLISSDNFKQNDSLTVNGNLKVSIGINGSQDASHTIGSNKISTSLNKDILSNNNQARSSKEETGITVNGNQYVEFDHEAETGNKSSKNLYEINNGQQSNSLGGNLKRVGGRSSNLAVSRNQTSSINEIQNENVHLGVNMGTSINQVINGTLSSIKNKERENISYISSDIITGKSDDNSYQNGDRKHERSNNNGSSFNKQNGSQLGTSSNFKFQEQGVTVSLIQEKQIRNQGTRGSFRFNKGTTNSQVLHGGNFENDKNISGSQDISRSTSTSQIENSRSGISVNQQNSGSQKTKIDYTKRVGDIGYENLNASLTLSENQKTSDKENDTQGTSNTPTESVNTSGILASDASLIISGNQGQGKVSHFVVHQRRKGATRNEGSEYSGTRNYNKQSGSELGTSSNFTFKHGISGNQESDDIVSLNEKGQSENQKTRGIYRFNHGITKSQATHDSVGLSSIVENEKKISGSQDVSSSFGKTVSSSYSQIQSGRSGLGRFQKNRGSQKTEIDNTRSVGAIGNQVLNSSFTLSGNQKDIKSDESSQINHNTHSLVSNLNLKDFKKERKSQNTSNTFEKQINSNVNLSESQVKHDSSDLDKSQKENQRQTVNSIGKSNPNIKQPSSLGEAPDVSSIQKSSHEIGESYYIRGNQSKKVNFNDSESLLVNITAEGNQKDTTSFEEVINDTEGTSSTPIKSVNTSGNRASNANLILSGNQEGQSEISHFVVHQRRKGATRNEGSEYIGIRNYNKQSGSELGTSSSFTFKHGISGNHGSDDIVSLNQKGQSENQKTRGIYRFNHGITKSQATYDSVGLSSIVENEKKISGSQDVSSSFAETGGSSYSQIQSGRSSLGRFQENRDSQKTEIDNRRSVVATGNQVLNSSFALSGNQKNIKSDESSEINHNTHSLISNLNLKTFQKDRKSQNVSNTFEKQINSNVSLSETQVTYDSSDLDKTQKQNQSKTVNSIGKSNPNSQQPSSLGEALDVSSIQKSSHEIGESYYIRGNQRKKVNFNDSENLSGNLLVNITAAGNQKGTTSFEEVINDTQGTSSTLTKSVNTSGNLDSDASLTLSGNQGQSEISDFVVHQRRKDAGINEGSDYSGTRNYNKQNGKELGTTSSLTFKHGVNGSQESDDIDSLNEKEQSENQKTRGVYRLNYGITGSQATHDSVRLSSTVENEKILSGRQDVSSSFGEIDSSSYSQIQSGRSSLGRFQENRGSQKTEIDNRRSVGATGNQVLNSSFTLSGNQKNIKSDESSEINHNTHSLVSNLNLKTFQKDRKSQNVSNTFEKQINSNVSLSETQVTHDSSDLDKTQKQNQRQSVNSIGKSNLNIKEPSSLREALDVTSIQKSSHEIGESYYIRGNQSKKVNFNDSENLSGNLLVNITAAGNQKGTTSFEEVINDTQGTSSTLTKSVNTSGNLDSDASLTLSGNQGQSEISDFVVHQRRKDAGINEGSDYSGTRNYNKQSGSELETTSSLTFKHGVNGSQESDDIDSLNEKEQSENQKTRGVYRLNYGITGSQATHDSVRLSSTVENEKILSGRQDVSSSFGEIDSSSYSQIQSGRSSLGRFQENRGSQKTEIDNRRSVGATGNQVLNSSFTLSGNQKNIKSDESSEINHNTHSLVSNLNLKTFLKDRKSQNVSNTFEKQINSNVSLSETQVTHDSSDLDKTQKQNQRQSVNSIGKSNLNIKEPSSLREALDVTSIQKSSHEIGESYYIRGNQSKKVNFNDSENLSGNLLVNITAAGNQKGTTSFEEVINDTQGTSSTLTKSVNTSGNLDSDASLTLSGNQGQSEISDFVVHQRRKDAGINEGSDYSGTRNYNKQSGSELETTSSLTFKHGVNGSQESDDIDSLNEKEQSENQKTRGVYRLNYGITGSQATHDSVRLSSTVENEKILSGRQDVSSSFGEIDSSSYSQIQSGRSSLGRFQENRSSQKTEIDNRRSVGATGNQVLNSSFTLSGNQKNIKSDESSEINHNTHSLVSNLNLKTFLKDRKSQNVSNTFEKQINSNVSLSETQVTHDSSDLDKTQKQNQRQSVNSIGKSNLNIKEPSSLREALDVTSIQKSSHEIGESYYIRGNQSKKVNFNDSENLSGNLLVNITAAGNQKGTTSFEEVINDTQGTSSTLTKSVNTSGNLDSDASLTLSGNQGQSEISDFVVHQRRKDAGINEGSDYSGTRNYNKQSGSELETTSSLTFKHGVNGSQESDDIDSLNEKEQSENQKTRGVYRLNYGITGSQATHDSVRLSSTVENEKILSGRQDVSSSFGEIDSSSYSQIQSGRSSLGRFQENRSSQKTEIDNRRSVGATGNQVLNSSFTLSGNQKNIKSDESSEINHNTHSLVSNLNLKTFLKDRKSQNVSNTFEKQINSNVSLSETQVTHDSSDLDKTQKQNQRQSVNSIGKSNLNIKEPSSLREALDVTSIQKSSHEIGESYYIRGNQSKKVNFNDSENLSGNLLVNITAAGNQKGTTSFEEVINDTQGTSSTLTKSVNTSGNLDSDASLTLSGNQGQSEISDFVVHQRRKDAGINEGSDYSGTRNYNKQSGSELETTSSLTFKHGVNGSQESDDIDSLNEKEQSENQKTRGVYRLNYGITGSQATHDSVRLSSTVENEKILSGRQDVSSSFGEIDSSSYSQIQSGRSSLGRFQENRSSQKTEIDNRRSVGATGNQVLNSSFTLSGNQKNIKSDESSEINHNTHSLVSNLNLKTFLKDRKSQNVSNTFEKQINSNVSLSETQVTHDSSDLDKTQKQNQRQSVNSIGKSNLNIKEPSSLREALDVTSIQKSSHEIGESYYIRGNQSKKVNFNDSENLSGNLLVNITAAGNQKGTTSFEEVINDTQGTSSTLTKSVNTSGNLDSDASLTLSGNQGQSEISDFVVHQRRKDAGINEGSDYSGTRSYNKQSGSELETTSSLTFKHGVNGSQESDDIDSLNEKEQSENQKTRGVYRLNYGITGSQATHDSVRLSSTVENEKILSGRQDVSSSFGEIDSSSYSQIQSGRSSLGRFQENRGSQKTEIDNRRSVGATGNQVLNSSFTLSGNQKNIKSDESSEINHNTHSLVSNLNLKTFLKDRKSQNVSNTFEKQINSNVSLSETQVTHDSSDLDKTQKQNQRQSVNSIGKSNLNIKEPSSLREALDVTSIQKSSHEIGESYYIRGNQSKKVNFNDSENLSGNLLVNITAAGNQKGTTNFEEVINDTQGTSSTLTKSVNTSGNLDSDASLTLSGNQGQSEISDFVVHQRRKDAGINEGSDYSGTRNYNKQSGSELGTTSSLTFKHGVNGSQESDDIDSLNEKEQSENQKTRGVYRLNYGITGSQATHDSVRLSSTVENEKILSGSQDVSSSFGEIDSSSYSQIQSGRSSLGRFQENRDSQKTEIDNRRSVVATGNQVLNSSFALSGNQKNIKSDESSEINHNTHSLISNLNLKTFQKDRKSQNVSNTFEKQINSNVSLSETQVTHDSSDLDKTQKQNQSKTVNSIGKSNPNSQQPSSLGEALDVSSIQKSSHEIGESYYIRGNQSKKVNFNDSENLSGILLVNITAAGNQKGTTSFEEVINDTQGTSSTPTKSVNTSGNLDSDASLTLSGNRGQNEISHFVVHQRRKDAGINEGLDYSGTRNYNKQSGSELGTTSSLTFKHGVYGSQESDDIVSLNEKEQSENQKTRGFRRLNYGITGSQATHDSVRLSSTVENEKILSGNQDVSSSYSQIQSARSGLGRFQENRGSKKTEIDNTRSVGATGNQVLNSSFTLFEIQKKTVNDKQSANLNLNFGTEPSPIDHKSLFSNYSLVSNSNTFIKDRESQNASSNFEKQLHTNVTRANQNYNRDSDKIHEMSYSEGSRINKGFSRTGLVLSENKKESAIDSFSSIVESAKKFSSSQNTSFISNENDKKIYNQSTINSIKNNTNINNKLESGGSINIKESEYTRENIVKNVNASGNRTSGTTLTLSGNQGQSQISRIIVYERKEGARKNEGPNYSVTRNYNKHSGSELGTSSSFEFQQNIGGSQESDDFLSLNLKQQNGSPRIRGIVRLNHGTTGSQATDDSVRLSSAFENERNINNRQQISHFFGRTNGANTSEIESARDFQKTNSSQKTEIDNTRSVDSIGNHVLNISFTLSGNEKKIKNDELNGNHGVHLGLNSNANLKNVRKNSTFLDKKDDTVSFIEAKVSDDIKRHNEDSDRIHEISHNEGSRLSAGRQDESRTLGLSGRLKINNSRGLYHSQNNKENLSNGFRSIKNFSSNQNSSIILSGDHKQSIVQSTITSNEDGTSINNSQASGGAVRINEFDLIGEKVYQGATSFNETRKQNQRHKEISLDESRLEEAVDVSQNLTDNLGKGIYNRSSQRLKSNSNGSQTIRGSLIGNIIAGHNQRASTRLDKIPSMLALGTRVSENQGHSTISRSDVFQLQKDTSIKDLSKYSSYTSYNKQSGNQLGVPGSHVSDESLGLNQKEQSGNQKTGDSIRFNHEIIGSRASVSNQNLGDSFGGGMSISSSQDISSNIGRAIGISASQKRRGNSDVSIIREVSGSLDTEIDNAGVNGKQFLDASLTINGNQGQTEINRFDDLQFRKGVRRNKVSTFNGSGSYNKQSGRQILGTSFETSSDFTRETSSNSQRDSGRPENVNNVQESSSSLAGDVTSSGNQISNINLNLSKSQGHGQIARFGSFQFTKGDRKGQITSSSSSSNFNKQSESQLGASDSFGFLHSISDSLTSDNNLNLNQNIQSREQRRRGSIRSNQGITGSLASDVNLSEHQKEPSGGLTLSGLLGGSVGYGRSHASSYIVSYDGIRKVQ